MNEKNIKICMQNQQFLKYTPHLSTIILIILLINHITILYALRDLIKFF